MTKPIYYLRPVCLEDAAMLLQWRNAEHVRINTLSGDHITQEKHQKWIQQSLSNPFPTQYMFGSAQRPLGTVGIKNLTDEGEAEWGFHFGVTDAPKGTATVMLAAFLKLVFEKIQLHRLIARVIVTNEKSVYLHQKLGFIEDRRVTGEVIRQGVPQDIIWYHYTAEHWQQKAKNWSLVTSSVSIEEE